MWCFRFHDNCMCPPTLPPPCTRFAQGCVTARDLLVWAEGFGVQAVAAALRDSGFSCQGLVDPVLEFVPPLKGI